MIFFPSSSVSSDRGFALLLLLFSSFHDCRGLFLLMMLAGKEVHAPQPKMSFLSSVGFIPIRGSSNGQRPVVSRIVRAGLKGHHFRRFSRHQEKGF
jgi:hypothetical protein